MLKALTLFFTITLLAFSVSAQTKTKPKPKPKPTPTPVKNTATEKKITESLKDLPESAVYTDKEKFYTIWMPAKPKAVEVTPPADPVKGSTKTQTKWDVDEGFVAVTRSHFANRTFNTAAEQDDILKLMRESLAGVAETKIVSDKESTVGKWRVVDIEMSSGEWVKTLVRVFIAGNEIYTLTATVDHNVEGAERLLLTAFDSFKIK